MTFRFLRSKNNITPVFFKSTIKKFLRNSPNKRNSPNLYSLKTKGIFFFTKGILKVIPTFRSKLEIITLSSSNTQFKTNYLSKCLKRRTITEINFYIKANTQITYSLSLSTHIQSSVYINQTNVQNQPEIDMMKLIYLSYS